MNKVNVTVFLSEQLLGRVRAEAEADDRSVSNFMERILRERYHGAGAVAPAGQMRQVDIAEEIAKAVKRGPVRKRK